MPFVALAVVVKLAFKLLAGIDEHIAATARGGNLQEEGVVGVRSGGEHQQDGILKRLLCLVNGNLFPRLSDLDLVRLDAQEDAPNV